MFARLLHDRVLVRKLPEKARLDGLILIKDHPDKVDVVNNDTRGEHDDYRRLPLVGEVLQVGPGKWTVKNKFKPTTVKPGEVVIFTDWNDWAGAPEDLFLITEGDIWGYPPKSNA